MAELKHAVVALPIIGGIIALIGALLPWASESGGGMSISYNILYIMWDLGAYGSETMLLAAALDDPCSRRNGNSWNDFFCINTPCNDTNDRSCFSSIEREAWWQNCWSCINYCRSIGISRANSILCRYYFRYS